MRGRLHRAGLTPLVAQAESQAQRLTNLNLVERCQAIATDAEKSADPAAVGGGDRSQSPGSDARPSVLRYGVAVDADAEFRQAQGDSSTNGGSAVEDRLPGSEDDLRASARHPGGHGGAVEVDLCRSGRGVDEKPLLPSPPWP